MRPVLVALLMTACSASPDGTPPHQVSILWPEGHRLYVGDSRQGVIRAFSTADGPRAVGEGRAPDRRRVFDMKLDVGRGRLWVLGPQAIYVHDAGSLALLHRYPVTGVVADSRLRLDDQGTAKVYPGHVVVGR